MAISLGIYPTFSDKPTFELGFTTCLRSAKLLLVFRSTWTFRADTRPPWRSMIFGPTCGFLHKTQVDQNDSGWLCYECYAIPMANMTFETMGPIGFFYWYVGCSQKFGTEIFPATNMDQPLPPPERSPLAGGIDGSRPAQNLDPWIRPLTRWWTGIENINKGCSEELHQGDKTHRQFTSTCCNFRFTSVLGSVTCCRLWLKLQHKFKVRGPSGKITSFRLWSKKPPKVKVWRPSGKVTPWRLWLDWAPKVKVWRP